MLKTDLIIGIDISKLTLDVCVPQKNNDLYFKVKNTPTNIRSFIKKVRRQLKAETIELVMENTGLYNWPIYKVCEELGLKLFVIHPMRIKNSSGLTRDKSDKQDAKRIAEYGLRFYDQMIPYKIPSKTIRKLQILNTLRSKIIETKKAFKSPVKELKSLAEKQDYKEMQKIANKMVKACEQQQKALGTELHQLIQSDKAISTNYELITSVQGVGMVLAWGLIIKTNNFTTLNTSKKLACYVGVVPFEHQSGTSVYRRPKVSYMADKKLKKVLHMSALRAVRLDGDLKQYYIRKVKEGKNKMLVLNAVRNKLIARICSVVKNQKKYQIDLILS